MYCVLDGIDGLGKDTQADMLIGRLIELQLNPLRVAQPCEDLPTGQFLRTLLRTGEYLKSHAPLFLADRLALQEAEIVPALEAGRIVVSVRSFLSTLVYQQENWDIPWLLSLHQRMLVKPDVVILLDGSPETGLERIGKRSKDKEVYEKLDIQQRNRERYKKLVHPYGEYHDEFRSLLADDAHVVIVDADGTRDITHNTIWQQIKHLFKNGKKNQEKPSQTPAETDRKAPPSPVVTL